MLADSITCVKTSNYTSYCSENKGDIGWVGAVVVLGVLVVLVAIALWFTRR